MNKLLSAWTPSLGVWGNTIYVRNSGSFNPATLAHEGFHLFNGITDEKMAEKWDIKNMKSSVELTHALESKCGLKW